MVGFVHNHPDRPFVMGGMFHGQVGLGGGSENRVKSIMTRSGHKVIFTEDRKYYYHRQIRKRNPSGHDRKQYQHHCSRNHDAQL